MFARTTTKFVKLVPTELIVKVKPEKVQLPELVVQFVLLRVENSAGAIITRLVELTAKEEAIAKGELMVRVMLEF